MISTSMSDKIAELFALLGPDLAVFSLVIAVVVGLRRYLQRDRAEKSKRNRSSQAAFREKAAAAESCPPSPKAEEFNSANSVSRSVPRGTPAADPTGLAQVVSLTISTRLQAAKALAYYNSLSADKKHLTLERDLEVVGSKHTAIEFYAALVQCAGRAGHPDLVLQLLDDMKEAGIERHASIYESAMRLLARHKFYKEAIQVYDRLDEDGLKPSLVTLSCLVGFAAELADVDRATDFFKKLSAEQPPSLKASMSLLRLHAKNSNWSASLALFRQIQPIVEIDAVLLNIILATGVAVGELEAAKELLIEAFHIADVVSYNTILKGLAQQGEVNVALELIHHMKKAGVSPNLISFNTAMDASIRGGKPNDAWRLFEIMQKDYGMIPDKCTCSTLVKGFTKTTTPTQIANILDLIDTVFIECSTQLRQNLLSSTLDVAIRIGHAPLAMRTFFKMRDRQIAASAKQLRPLLTLTAKHGDAEACLAAWTSVQDNSELVHAWKSLKSLMSEGHSITQATLKLAPMLLQPGR